MENTATMVYKTEKGTPVTNSLLVAEKFGKRHYDVIRSIEQLVDGLNSTDEKLRWFYKSEYCDAKGEYRKMYVMNKDGFSLLVMGFNGSQSFQFKVDFIEQFNRMESYIKSVQQFNLPTHAEALRLYADQLEENEKLQQRITQQDNALYLKDNYISELTPDAQYAREVLMSDDTFTTTQIAKELGYGAVTLNEKLRQLDVQYKHNDQWLLKYKYQDKGYTKVNTYSQTVNGITKTHHTTVWTEKGRKFIHNLLSN